MGSSFRRDVDDVAQMYLRDRVNYWISPYHAASYPPNCRTEPLAPYDTDPLMSHPSYYGSIATDPRPRPPLLRSDVIALAYCYANVVRGKYGSINGGTITGGGIAYFCLNDDMATWDPTNSNEVNRFTVGTGQGFYGYSDGGGEDDGVSGTRAKCGYLDGQNVVNETKLSYWPTNYLGTNGNNILYLRLRGAGYTPVNWVLTIYDESGNLIMGGRLVKRSGTDAFYVPGSFSLASYVNRTLYIRIRPDNPPMVGVPGLIPNHRVRVLNELNTLGTLSGDLSLYSVRTQYNTVWEIINARKDDVTVDLTTFSADTTSSGGSGGGGGTTQETTTTYQQ